MNAFQCKVQVVNESELRVRLSVMTSENWLNISNSFTRSGVWGQESDYNFYIFFYKLIREHVHLRDDVID
jgi:hypothetical protein